MKRTTRRDTVGYNVKFRLALYLVEEVSSKPTRGAFSNIRNNFGRRVSLWFTVPWAEKRQLVLQNSRGLEKRPASGATQVPSQISLIRGLKTEQEKIKKKKNKKTCMATDCGWSWSGRSPQGPPAELKRRSAFQWLPVRTRSRRGGSGGTGEDRPDRCSARPELSR